MLTGARFGDDAPFAHALGEQRLAERVVDLVRAGVREVLALEENPRATRVPTNAGSIPAWDDRRSALSSRSPVRLRRPDRRTARYARSSSSTAATTSPARTARRTRQSIPARIRITPMGPPPVVALGASSRARKNALKRSWSLMPGALSTPDDTSIPNGRTVPNGFATFSGVRPPARIDRRVAAIAAAADQSIVRPVPPRFTGSCTSSRSVTRVGHSSRRQRRRPRRRNRFDDRTPAAPHDGSSSPCNCTAPSPTVARPNTCSAGWFTKTPTGVTKGGRSATIARARPGSMKRGLSGQNTNPKACAPASTAARASSARVMPQNLTSMG